MPTACLTQLKGTGQAEQLTDIFMRSSSGHLSVSLSPPKPRAEFNQTCYITTRHGKGVREQHHFSMRPSFVHLSVTLSPAISQGGIQLNLLHHSPPMVGVLKSNIIFPCPCVRRPSICLPCYLLLNHWAEFNHTCYITSPRVKGVREQHFFRASVVHLSIRHAVSS